jgi:hypothetical protein
VVVVGLVVVVVAGLVVVVVAGLVEVVVVVVVVLVVLVVVVVVGMGSDHAPEQEDQERDTGGQPGVSADDRDQHAPPVWRPLGLPLRDETNVDPISAAVAHMPVIMSKN